MAFRDQFPFTVGIFVIYLLKQSPQLTTKNRIHKSSRSNISWEFTRSAEYQAPTCNLWEQNRCMVCINIKVEKH